MMQHKILTAMANGINISILSIDENEVNVVAFVAFVKFISLNVVICISILKSIFRFTFSGF